MNQSMSQQGHMYKGSSIIYGIHFIYHDFQNSGIRSGFSRLLVISRTLNMNIWRTDEDMDLRFSANES